MAQSQDLIDGRDPLVGLGRSTHGAHELSLLTHRILRFLVERLGFRALAIEDDWTMGIEIDEYLRTGRGDPRELLDGISAHLRTEELLHVLLWMRTYNERQPADPVRLTHRLVRPHRLPPGSNTHTP